MPFVKTSSGTKFISANTSYKKLLDNMNEAVWLGDKNERTVYVNKKFADMLGYTIEEMIGRESYDFWDKESAERVKNVNKTKRKKGISSSYEGNLLTKDGKKIPVLLHGSPFPGGGTVGIMTDLTELRNKEEKEKVLNLSIKRLLDTMNEAVWLGDKDERTVFANKKLAKILGYNLEEMMGRESYDFWDKESAARVKNVNKTKRKQGISSSYEGNLLTKHGKKIPVLLSGSPFPGGGTVGIMTDLTEIKKKEEKERILSKSVEYSTDAIIIFDKTLTIQSWNRGANLIFGYNKKEMLNSKLTKIFSTKDIQKFLKNKKAFNNSQISIHNKSKNKAIIDATVTHIHKENNKNDKIYLLIARDQTKKIKFEKELMEKYEKMKTSLNSAVKLFETYKKLK